MTIVILYILIDIDLIIYGSSNVNYSQSTSAQNYGPQNHVRKNTCRLFPRKLYAAREGATIQINSFPTVLR